MKIFKCLCVKENKKFRKIIFATDKEEAISKLSDFHIITINEFLNLNVFNEFDDNELETIFYQFSFSYKAGISITNILDSINPKNDQNRIFIENMKENLEFGEPLSQAVERSRACNSFIYAMFKIGEKTGNMANICTICAEEMKRKNEFKGSIKKILIYPLVTLISVILALVIISIYVTPQFIEIYSELKVELPITTQILIFFSKLINTYYIYFLAFIFLIVFGTKFLKKFNFYSSFSLKIPILKDLIINYEMYRYFLGLSIFLRSHMNLPKSLEICTNLIGNAKLRSEFFIIIDEIDAGNPFSYGLKKLDTKIINISLIKGCELSGNLDKVLEINYMIYKKKYEDLLEYIKILSEPAMTIVMGVLISFIAIALISPIWSLSEVIL